MVYLLLVVFLVVTAEILDINKCDTKFVYEGMNTPFFGFNARKYRRKVFVLFFFLLASLVMGFRDLTVGLDTNEYRNMWLYVTEQSYSTIFSKYGIFTGIELGYALLMKVCSVVFNNYYYFQLLCAIVFCLSTATFIYSDVEDIEMRILIFIGIGFYLLAFNVMRQLIAVMLIMNAWKLFDKKKYLPAFALYFFAVLLHSTAIFTIVIVPVAHFTKSQKFVNACPFALFACALLCAPLILAVVEFFPKYSEYILNQQIAKPGFVSIVWLIVAFLALAVIYHKTEFDREDKTIAIFCLLYVATSILGIKVVRFDRFGYYFMPFTFILLPKCVRLLKGMKIEWLYGFGVKISFLLYYAVDVFSREPYATFVLNSFK